jgi:hypothetical protein
MAKHQDPGRCIDWTTTISVVLLALVAAVVSFGHMRELALAALEGGRNDLTVLPPAEPVAGGPLVPGPPATALAQLM